MKLSVIIVNYNVKYFLEQALISVWKSIDFAKKKDSNFSTEVIIVDNNSVDGSNEMLKEKFPWVKLIENKDNPGFSIANNQGIAISQGEYILLLNPDTVIQEDTLFTTVQFMDEHPDGGGLGCKMVDGKGIFLPESKRGLPTPKVAFYKIFGLSKLFPTSKEFGKYHLGYLKEDDINEVEVLAGAFMLLRKSVLVDIGLLDETFFMYGEDIDLSYRITLAGYKNYYFPNTTIIHYKGESTKKGSLNYVFIFYQAMVIFAKKHFSQRSAKMFSILINLAVYLRAFIAIFTRTIKALTLPLFDFLLQYFSLYLIVNYWEHTIKYIQGGGYPNILYSFFLPIYILFWMSGILINGGYQKSPQLIKIFRGIVLGSVLLIIFYAFLDESYRFSRAIIVLGSISAFFIFSINRLLMNFIKTKSILGATPIKKIAIIGEVDECNRVVSLLQNIQLDYTLIGYILPNLSDVSSPNLTQKTIGYLSNITEMCRIYNINELIFCGKDVPTDVIINQMMRMKNLDISFKIVPENSQFIIGSNSKDRPGDYYTLEQKLSLFSAENLLNKRLLDVFMSFFFIITLPINILLIKKKLTAITNFISVLIGRKTFVGFSSPHNSFTVLPKLKKGILSPQTNLKGNISDFQAQMRLDYLYAKDYTIYDDIIIIFRGFNQLGD